MGLVAPRGEARAGGALRPPPDQKQNTLVSWVEPPVPCPGLCGWQRRRAAGRAGGWAGGATGAGAAGALAVEPQLLRLGATEAPNPKGVTASPLSCLFSLFFFSPTSQ
jgi:hypothetical protein